MFRSDSLSQLAILLLIVIFAAGCGHSASTETAPEVNISDAAVRHIEFSDLSACDADVLARSSVPGAMNRVTSCSEGAGFAVATGEHIYLGDFEGGLNPVASMSDILSGDVSGIQLTSDPTRIALLDGEAGLVEVLDESGKALFDVGGDFEAMSLGPGGDWLATIATDGTVNVWDPDAGVPLASFEGGGTGEGISPSGGGRRIIARTAEGISLLDVESGRVESIPLERGLLGDVLLSEGVDTIYVATEEPDSSVYAFDPNLEARWSYLLPGGVSPALVADATGEHLLVYGAHEVQAYVTAIHGSSGRALWRLTLEEGYVVSSASWDDDGRAVLGVLEESEERLDSHPAEPTLALCVDPGGEVASMVEISEGEIMDILPAGRVIVHNTGTGSMVVHSPRR